MKKRNRKMKSIKNELLTKSREAMLSAVQIFNNPNIQFKSESFIVLSNIAWIYLLHAHYREKGVEYRYHKMLNVKRRFEKTKNGAYKYWELTKCLNAKDSPIDPVTTKNLKFLIGLRHEIEHKMTTKIYPRLSDRFQSCCLNYNKYIKELFGEKFSIDRHLSVSLQFSTINEKQAKKLIQFTDLPKNISTYINGFDNDITDEQFIDRRFACRVFYEQKSVNTKRQADKVINFVPANTPGTEKLNKDNVVVKEREKKKYLPSNIVELMQKKGYSEFKIYHHTQLWKEKNGKNPQNHFGVQVQRTWYWYETWVKEVEKYCAGNKEKFKTVAQQKP